MCILRPRLLCSHAIAMACRPEGEKQPERLLQNWLGITSVFLSIFITLLILYFSNSPEFSMLHHIYIYICMVTPPPHIYICIIIFYIYTRDPGSWHIWIFSTFLAGHEVWALKAWPLWDRKTQDLRWFSILRISCCVVMKSHEITWAPNLPFSPFLIRFFVAVHWCLSTATVLMFSFSSSPEGPRLQRGIWKEMGHGMIERNPGAALQF